MGKQWYRRSALLGIVGGGAGAVGLVSGGATDGTSAAVEGQAGQAQTGDGRCDFVVSRGTSIQATVDAASPGDSVCVEPGRYEESITIDKPELTLRSTDPQAAVIDVTGRASGVRIEADGVTVEGFEIRGDSGTTTGVSIVTSAGATEDITVRANHIHGMAKAGGGGPFGVASWGLLAWGDNPLSGVLVEDNVVEEIGGDSGGLPVGIGIDLEEVEGDRPRGGAAIRRNTLRNLFDAEVSVMGRGITLPGVGVAIQPLDGASSGAGDPAADIHRNSITSTSIDIVLGETGLTRVMDNTG